MSFDPQDVVALSLAALAGGYLLWRGWSLVRRQDRGGGCGGGCSKCASSLPIATPQLTPIRLVDRDVADGDVVDGAG